ncbi:alpha-galactosidase [Microlunatus capsulatus]|uniref:Alpha-galactosidase n=1 Tax=Microlunatus capsulatus TaxID=99117 RepID=A0ABS4Z4H7_9ACTN|nr:alpha-galactosidase [Microlunatus capsulatus]MBP2415952.1 alpha-galactosidase [Microlunatus capsulatus]
MAQPHAFVVLRRDGAAAVLDVTAGRLPALVHWGADLGPLSGADAAALALGGHQQVDNNLVDRPLRVSLLPEHWTGWTGRPGISGSRAGTDWSPRFTVVALAVDGAEVVGTAQEPALAETSSGVVEVRAEDAAAGLGVVLQVELTAGGLLRSRASLTNTGEGVYQLDDLVLAYPLPAVAREVLDLAGRWGKERTAQRTALQVGTHLREGRKGRTGPDAATVLHVGTPGFGFAEGEVWGVHTAWSGNHVHYAERVFTGHQVVGGGELLLPGEVRLATGETYTSPWVYGSHGTGLDAVARRFHRYLRSRPQHPGPERPVTLNVWEAVYFDHDLERLLDLAERAAALGVERYVLDDGWFGSRRDDTSGLGDWVVSADVWPDGLHPLVDRVRELGMEFGLWFEPEMVNLDSDVARAHPEWVLATGDRTPVPSRNQQVLNLGIPEAYAHVRDQMSALLDEYAIGYIKWDHNRDLVDAGTSPSGRAGVHEQTLAFYRLVDELKAAHPGLEVESCSSGGARVDLGVLERTERVWVSDCIDPLERQEMHRWTTQLVPPEMMGAHIASGGSHTTGRVHDLSFRAATAVFGHLGIEWDLARASEQELAELGGWVAFFKEHRRLLLGGDLVRVDHPDTSVVLHGVVSPDRDAAIFGVHAVGRSEVVSLGRLRFPGLDPARRYRVVPVGVGEPGGLVAPAWWDADGPRAGTVLSGAALGAAGLMAASVHPDHSVLYRLDAVG